MKVIVIVLLISIVMYDISAHEYDDYILFEGTIVSNDSLPVANVHLLSYNTLRVFTTDVK